MKEEYRMPYILLSENLAKGCKTASIPREEVQETISDHYPVVVTIDRPRK